MDAQLLVQLLLGGFGITGFIGAYLAIRKLPTEQNSAAVTQSKDAMSTMKELNEELKADRDYWRARAIDAEGKLKLEGW